MVRTALFSAEGFCKEGNAILSFEIPGKFDEQLVITL